MRNFEKLRVSVSELCNLSCQFCDGVDDLQAKHQKSIHKPSSLSVTDYLNIIEKLYKKIPLKEIRITGGEPTIYPHLLELVEGISNIGIKSIYMTSNGILLEDKLEMLKKNGLKGINISLEALNEDIFLKMTRKNGVLKILKSINKAQNFNFELKINTTIMRHINDTEILPIADYAFSLNIPVRFLELMQMGPITKKEFTKHFFSQAEILKVIEEKYKIQHLPRKMSSTAEYWTANDHYIFGIIANESAPFCSDCNRLRLDSKGFLYGCLSNSNGFFIKDKADLSEILEKAIQQKQNKFIGSSLNMREIGG